MRVEVNLKELATTGLEIGIVGAMDSPSSASDYPSQVYIEFHDGKVKVHVWNGVSEDPTVSVPIPLTPQKIKVIHDKP